MFAKKGGKEGKAGKNKISENAKKSASDSEVSGTKETEIHAAIHTHLGNFAS